MNMANKERLDVLLVEKGYITTREKAKKMIMAGLVFVDGQREDKAGTKIAITAKIHVKKDPNPYVSRGGLKLQKAIQSFDLDLEGKVCMDVGASTGGFTDCMLQHGAIKVFSVDVGYGQFDWSLRQDARVICLEKTNIRYVTDAEIPDPLDFVSIDVSFISLKKVLPAVYALMKESSHIVCLIKPQFEAGRDKIGKKGVVRDPGVHQEVIESLIHTFSSIGLTVMGLSYSPITGPEGNIEYLICAQKLEDSTLESRQDMNEIYVKSVNELVNHAHRDLYRK